MWLSHFLASGVGLQKQSDWYYNKYWPILETTTEKTQRLIDINNKLYKFFEKEGIVSTNKLTDTFINLTQRGLDLTNIATEELTTTFAKVPKVMSDIDDAQDLLNDAMNKNKGVVEEQEKAVESATKSWIDYHMAIGLFQPIKDATGMPGSIESMMPSMMGAQGQQAYLDAVMMGGKTKAEALNWIKENPQCSL